MWHVYEFVTGQRNSIVSFQFFSHLTSIIVMSNDRIEISLIVFGLSETFLKK